MSRAVEKLLFVYDAKSGRVGAFLDSAKKMLMLKSCALCTITHGVLGEKSDWASCKSALAVPIEYFHRDDVPAAVRTFTGGKLPCVVARLAAAEEYALLLGSDELDLCKGSVAELQVRLRGNAETLRLRLG